MDDLFKWMIERHSIYLKRRLGLTPPWTDDVILQTYKFTNVFRELDRGTIVLRQKKGEPIFNTVWYRMFNRAEHDQVCDTPSQLETYLWPKELRGEKMFTSAHMSYGKVGISKTRLYLDILRDWYAHIIDVQDIPTMEATFNHLRKVPGIGPFIGYEMVCDLRFSLREYPDRNNWANVGPGAKRGMERLGYEPTVATMRLLWEHANHRGLFRGELFELREIEHSLCEFDKYERVRLGEGRPKEKYHAGRSLPLNSSDSRDNASLRSNS